MPGQMARSMLTSPFLSEGNNASALQLGEADPVGCRNGEGVLSVRMRENVAVSAWSAGQQTFSALSPPRTPLLPSR